MALYCSVFAWVGMIPIIGAGPARHALRLHQRVLAEAGWNWSRPVLRGYWVGGLGLSAAYFFVCGWAVAFFILCLFAALQGRRIASCPIHPATPDWKPIQERMETGVALAHSGLLISAGAVQTLLLAAVEAVR